LLKGEKCFLRAVELEDSRIISAWLNDRETNRYLQVIYPVSKRYSDAYVMEADEDKSKKMFIIDNSDMKSIGLVVFSNIKWEFRNCEIGIAIYDKNHRRRGYGRDGLETAIKFAFDDMNMHLIYLNVYEANEGAINLYKSLGFRQEGILRDRYYKDGKYGNIIVMSRLKNEG
jgi:diamine N-acetyltransferase